MAAAVLRMLQVIGHRRGLVLITLIPRLPLSLSTQQIQRSCCVPPQDGDMDCIGEKLDRIMSWVFFKEIAHLCSVVSD